MSVRVLEIVRIDGQRRDGAVLMDSVTGLAFGPVFEDAEEAEAFQAWLRTHGHGEHVDARRLGDDIADAVRAFRGDVALALQDTPAGWEYCERCGLPTMAENGVCCAESGAREASP